METDQRTQFLHAQRFERELNPRQRDILQRLARGQTNAEIAAALDMTFVGAAMRSLAAFHLPAKQVIAGAGLAAVAVVAAVAFTSFRGNPGTGTAFTPVHLEYVQRDASGTITSSARWHWKNKTTYRLEVTRPATADQPADTTLSIADGEYGWGTSTIRDTYNRATLNRSPIYRNQNGADLSIPFVGPTRVRDVDSLLELMRTESDIFDPANPRWAMVVGTGEAMGRPATVIEFGPLYSNGTAERRASGEAITSEGTGKVWLDESTMAILRFEVHPPELGAGTAAVVEATSLDMDPEFDADTFRFEPPAGKTMTINGR